MSARSLALAALLLTVTPLAAGPPIDPSAPPCAQMAPTPPPVTAFYRANPYDSWQYYDLSRQGHWVPRVIAAPGGDYYQYNGQPYLLGTVNPQYYKSVQLGTPYRSAP